MKSDFETWLESDEGKRCSGYPIVGGEQYLKNRLWWAFEAGRRSSRPKLKTPGDKLEVRVAKDFYERLQRG